MASIISLVDMLVTTTSTYHQQLAAIATTIEYSSTVLVISLGQLSEKLDLTFHFNGESSHVRALGPNRCSGTTIVPKVGVSSVVMID